MNKILKISFLTSLSFILTDSLTLAQEDWQGECSEEQILTENIKIWDRNGNYSYWAKKKITQAHLLQEHLNRLGFSSGKADGIIGPISTGAIKRMQKYLGVVQDGWVGPKTRAVLNNSCGDEGREEKEEKVVSEEGEKISQKPGEKILATGKQMVQDKDIIKGACWDYIHEVFNRSGYPYAKRETIHKGAKNNGPYADQEDIQPGDWLYHINYSYNQVEHSGIFVRWIDYDKKIGETLSYGGESRNEPGRYKEYDLKSVYNIIRGVE